MLGRAVSTWGSRIGFFTAISVLLHAPWIAVRLASWDWDSHRPDSPLLELLYALLGFGLSFLAAGGVAHAVVKSSRGGDPGVLESVGVAARRCATIAGIASFVLLLELATTVASGLVFRLVFGDGQVTGAWTWLFVGFAVPAAAVFATAWVAVPAAIVENATAGRALARSRALLRGSFVAAVRLTFLLGTAYLVTMALTVAWSRNLERPATFWMLASTAVQVLGIAPVAAVASAVSYYDLRVAKEGTSSADLERVFE